jgi:hypothetical protein
MTPLGIQIMLQCYCSAEPWANMPPRIWNSPAADATRVVLVTLGLIDAETLRATAKGKAYVDALCAVNELRN